MKFSEFALFFWIFYIFNLAQPLESRLHKEGDWIITFLVNVHNGLRIINQQKPLHDMSEQHIHRFYFNFNLFSFPTTFRLSSPVSAVLSRPAYILEFVDHPPRQKKPAKKDSSVFPLSWTHVCTDDLLFLLQWKLWCFGWSWLWVMSVAF